MLSLLCLSFLLTAVCLAAPTTVQTNTTLDISACPITYFGGGPYTAFNTAFSGTISFTFSSTDEITFPNSAVAAIHYDILPAANLTAVDVKNAAAAIETTLRRLPASAVECCIKISATFNGPTNIYIFSYGSQTAAFVDADIGATDAFTFSYFGDGSYSTKVPGAFSQAVDLTRCRDDTRTYASGEIVATYDETCSSDICQPSGVVELTNDCGPGQVCMGLGCGARHSCSIVANSVVDVNGDTGVIPDFCAYDIITAPSFTMTAFLRERRLTDTPFVDSVDIYTTPSLDHVSLGQGGNAKKTVSGADTALTLNSSAVTVLGLELSDNGTGLLALFTDHNNIITEVFFDGTLLHVKHTGVCFDASTISAVKNAGLSESGCIAELASVEVASVDKGPFVTACAENLLCGYPDRDDLYCRFKHAYARTAGLSSNGCSTSVCLNHQCVSHEFCAVANSGRAACFCRSNDATTKAFRKNGKYGPPPTCDAGSASLEFYGCLLEEEGINYRGLHLNDENCTGVVDSDYNTITFDFDTNTKCGGTYRSLPTTIEFQNTVQNTYSQTVTYEPKVAIIFSCSYNKTAELTPLNFHLINNFVTATYTTDSFRFTLSISFYYDAAFTSAVASGAELTKGQKVYVKLKSSQLRGTGLVLVIDECWTTTESSPTGANKYSLIQSQ
uniref:ZP domain-containing protein n=1 Tax=Knipowitschia caucasica TaxID=637954 RepID=A0AAV2KRW5_KNICA